MVGSGYILGRQLKRKVGLPRNPDGPFSCPEGQRTIEREKEDRQ